MARPPASVTTISTVPRPNGVPVIVPWSSIVPGVVAFTIFVLPSMLTAWRLRLPGVRAELASW